MNIFEIPLLIIVYFMVFTFFWRWVVVLPITAIAELLKFRKIATFGLLAAQAYVNATFIAGAIKLYEGDFSLGVAIFTVILFSIYSLSGISENQKSMEQNATSYEELEEIEQSSNIKFVSIFLSLIMLILFINVPSLISPTILLYISGLLYWVLDIPIIGFLVQAGAVLYFIALAFNVIIVVPVLIAMGMGSISNFFKRKK